MAHQTNSHGRTPGKNLKCLLMDYEHRVFEAQSNSWKVVQCFQTLLAAGNYLATTETKTHSLLVRSYSSSANANEVRPSFPSDRRKTPNAFLRCLSCYFYCWGAKRRLGTTLRPNITPGDNTKTAQDAVSTPFMEVLGLPETTQERHGVLQTTNGCFLACASKMS